MDWKNGRKLTDLKELQNVKDWYFDRAYVSDVPNEELMEQQSRRVTKNQAR